MFPLTDAMGLVPHPEGGHHRRTWTTSAQMDTPRGNRHSAFAIIFLPDRDKEARQHPVHSDELWIWLGSGALKAHSGGSGDVSKADPCTVTLGSPAGAQASDASNPAQILMLVGTWQRTFARSDYALATCVISSEFTFDGWKLAEGA